MFDRKRFLLLIFNFNLKKKSFVNNVFCEKNKFYQLQSFIKYENNLINVT